MEADDRKNLKDKYDKKMKGMEMLYLHPLVQRDVYYEKI